MKNLSQMMRQAQDMQRKMEEMQTAMENMAVEGTAGGGLVKVTLNGKGALLDIAIDPTVLKDEDHETVEDLIKAAFGEAKARADQMMKDEMSAMTGGLDLPPGMKLPF